MKLPAFSPITLVSGILLFGAGVFAVGIWRGESSLRTFLALRGSKNTLTEAVGGLERSNEELSDEISRIKQSKSYAKRVLRDKYHVTDADEKIVFFAD